MTGSINPEPSQARPTLLREIKVINIGVELFAQALQQQGVKVIQVDWRPPAGGDAELRGMLDKIL